tara:strand:+ start:395 stop:670 length:276 start_codon:yes stop_codon:yes gene_type:complete
LGENNRQLRSGNMEATTYVLFFSATSSFLFLCVGIVAGWTAKDFMHDYFYTEEESVSNMHPEMYDQAGQYIHEELYSVKFVDEDDLNETID